LTSSSRALGFRALLVVSNAKYFNYFAKIEGLDHLYTMGRS